MGPNVRAHIRSVCCSVLFSSLVLTHKFSERTASLPTDFDPPTLIKANTLLPRHNGHGVSQSLISITIILPSRVLPCEAAPPLQNELERARYFQTYTSPSTLFDLEPASIFLLARSSFRGFIATDSLQGNALAIPTATRHDWRDGSAVTPGLDRWHTAWGLLL